MPHVGASAQWGEAERGEDWGPQDHFTDTETDRRSSLRDRSRYSGPRPVRAAAPHGDPHLRAVTPIGDFDFSSARVAAAARRRSGPARPAARFAEPVRQLAIAPAPAASAPAPAASAPRHRRRDIADRYEAPVREVEAEPRRSPDGRRIVTIQGRPAERYAPTVQRRRSAQRAYEREGFRPDRAAMWAVLLGMLMILAAATSAHGAVLSHHALSAAHSLAQLPR